MILRYAKNSKNQKIGLLVADVYHNEVCLGWALCHKKDTFDRTKALEISAGRLKNNNRIDEMLLEIPFSMENLLKSFLIRSIKYFKDEKFSVAILNLMDYYEININKRKMMKFSKIYS